MQARLASSGLCGSAVLGALIGTVMSPCATPALATLLMGAMMIFLTTFVITMANVGPVSDFLACWARAFLIADVVGVPVIYFLAPTARKLTARFVEMP